MKVRHFAQKIIEDKQSEKSFLFWLRFLFAPHTCRAHARGSDPSPPPAALVRPVVRSRIRILHAS